MNEVAVQKMGWILETMRYEAKRREAPVNDILDFTKGDPFRSLVLTILSARTKDANSMKAGAAILEHAPNAKSLASMPIKGIERLVKSSGYYHVKARHLKEMAKILLKDFQGKVPSTIEELTRLPGVGRKTANIILVYSFRKYAIPVDTHVHRISNRLGLAKTKTPDQTEKALEASIPKRFWRGLNHAFVSYGQTICLPRNPKCKECRLYGICVRIGVG